MLIEIAALLDAGSLSAELPEIVKLCAANLSLALDVYLLDRRAVQREYPLNANAVGYLANGERLVKTAVLARYDNPLEDLDPLAGSLLDLNVNTKGISGTKLRCGVRLEIFLLDKVKYIHFRPNLHYNTAQAP